MNLAAGRFFVPSCYEGNQYVSKFTRLLTRVAGRLGATLSFADDVRAADLPADCPFVFLLKPVQWGRSTTFRGALDLPPRIRLFGLWDDIHQGPAGTRRLSRDRWTLTRFFRRCDTVFCTYRAPFLSWYPRHAAKLVHLPFFFSADDFQDLTPNPAPLPKCLLSGAMGRFYPLRNAAARHPDVVVMPHPGYAGDAAGAFGSTYARTLWQYRCGITCAATIGYTVAKYLEIPAAGSLLLASDAPDLPELGHEAGHTFVRVDERNFGTVLADVLARPEGYEEIRQAGHALVRARHSDLDRAEALERILRERCAAPPR